METQAITLGGLAEGAAEQLFQEAFARVLENIDDPNTKWDAKRNITLSFGVWCDEERRSGEIEIACVTKIPGPRAVQTQIHLGRHRGAFTAVEAMRQEEMFGDPVGRPEPVPAAVVSGGGE